MYSGNQEGAWTHTAHLMTLLANINRDPKKSRRYRVTDFLPPQFARNARRRRGGMTGAQLRSLKPLFEKQR